MSRWLLLAVIGAFCLVHDPLPSEWKTFKMTSPSPRVQAIVSKLEPHCFGRFLIDLPEGATVAWGGGLGLTIERGRAGELEALVKAKEDDRKSEERYPLTKHLNLYFETRSGALPYMKHVISQKDFASDGSFRINTYFALGDALVTRQSFALTAELGPIIAEIEDDLRRLRLRANDEIPSEPGQCIDNGFMVDRPNEAQLEMHDFIDVGFRLKDPPDAHLSISIEPANNEQAKPGLEKQIADTEAEARRNGDFNPFKAITVMRRARREVHDWKDGFEMLTKTHGTETSRPHHDFWMVFAGQIDKLDHPYVDIRLSDGVADDATGKIDPTLTDAEAIALWDALTETIRVRPTAVATSAAPQEARVGTHVATGDACPRTGLWQCAPEPCPVQGGSRQWFRAGETMPSAILLAAPTLLQRLRGEAPSFASRTVWTLVSVEAQRPS